MVLEEIRNYELLKARIGQEGVEAFVGLIDMSVDRKFEEKQIGLGLKEDVSNLKEDVSNLKQDVSNLKQDVSNLKQDVSNVRVELKEEISKVRLEFKDNLNKVSADLTQKIYLASLGQLLAIVASVVSLILLLKK